MNLLEQYAEGVITSGVPAEPPNQAEVSVFFTTSSKPSLARAPGSPDVMSPAHNVVSLSRRSRKASFDDLQFPTGRYGVKIEQDDDFQNAKRQLSMGGINGFLFAPEKVN